MPRTSPTACLLTPRGRGAVASIAVEAAQREFSRLDSLFAAANGVRLSEQRVGRICFGVWGGREPKEELVVCRVAADRLEVHSHGGEACVNRVLTDLHEAGFPAATDTPTGTSSEVARAIQQAPTLRTAAILLNQQQLWPVLLQRWQGLASEELRTELRQVLSWSEFGLHLTKPWQVALAGEPNVGKSTLFNALVGFERSIVFDEPGTTRDVVSARTVFGGWPIQLNDTAGIRETSDAVESGGVAAALDRARTADLQIIVSDLTRDQIADPVAAAPQTIRVGNKADLATTRHAVDVVVSSTTGAGIESLIERIEQELVPEPPPEQQCVPVSKRHVAWLKQLAEAADADDLCGVHDALRQLRAE